MFGSGGSSITRSYKVNRTNKINLYIINFDTTNLNFVIIVLPTLHDFDIFLSFQKLFLFLFSTITEEFQTANMVLVLYKNRDKFENLKVHQGKKFAKKSGKK